MNLFTNPIAVTDGTEGVEIDARGAKLNGGRSVHYIHQKHPMKV
jgi:hypothetical protein